MSAPAVQGPRSAAPWSRGVSGSERLWLANARQDPPFAIALMLEGVGAPDVPAWRQALAIACEANPGARLVLRGWPRSRWHAAGSAGLRVLKDQDWSGKGPEGAPFLTQPLDPRQGPTVELLLLRGHHQRLVVRALHAAMDGRGTLAFLYDLFRARRGEPPIGHADPRLDLDLLGRGPSHSLPPTTALPPMGAPAPLGRERLWTRLSLDPVPGPLLARVLAALAEHARTHQQGLVRFEVPVDLRREHPDVRSTGNLTAMVAVEVPEVSPEAAGEALREQVAAGSHHARVRGTRWLVHTPQWAIDAGMRHFAARHQRQETFAATAFVSNLGRVDLARLSAPDFTAERLVFLPPTTHFTPLFVAIAGSSTGVDLVLASNERFGGDGRLETLTEHLRARLVAPR